MLKKVLILGIGLLIFSGVLFFALNKEKLFEEKETLKETGKEILLSLPKKESFVSVEGAILKRRSIREYKKTLISFEKLSQILWAAQGITDEKNNLRAVPSAGAIYPLEIYLVVKNVERIEPGVYYYVSKEHKIKKVILGDFSEKLAEAAVGQKWVREAPVNLIFLGDVSKTTEKYGERGIYYVYMEAGHAAQNVYLQAQSLSLGTVTVGAFIDKNLKDILKASEEKTPLYIMPLGEI